MEGKDGIRFVTLHIKFFNFQKKSVTGGMVEMTILALHNMQNIPKQDLKKSLCSMILQKKT